MNQIKLDPTKPPRIRIRKPYFSPLARQHLHFPSCVTSSLRAGLGLFQTLEKPSPTGGFLWRGEVGPLIDVYLTTEIDNENTIFQRNKYKA